MNLWSALAMIFFFFLVFGGAQAIVRLVEGRRKHQMELLKEQRRIAEAQAKENELEYKRRELEYREAALELERFDRRMLPSGEQPDDSDESPTR